MTLLNIVNYINYSAIWIKMDIIENWFLITTTLTDLYLIVVEIIQDFKVKSVEQIKAIHFNYLFYLSHSPQNILD